MHIDVVALDAQAVAARHLDHEVAVAQTTPQPRHECLQGVRRIERRFLAPQRLHEGGLRDRARDVDCKADQETPQPGTGKVDGAFGTGFTGADVEGSEQIDPHPFTIPAANDQLAVTISGALLSSARSCAR